MEKKLFVQISLVIDDQGKMMVLWNVHYTVKLTD